MKFKATLSAFFLFLAVLSARSIHANTLIAGGYVPEKRALQIALNNAIDFQKSDQNPEIATIFIENNLPHYQLIFDLKDKYGSGENISEVILEKISGNLGLGIDDPGRFALYSPNQDGIFVWNPGRQESATTGYAFRVIVIFKNKVDQLPQMTVTMPHYL